MYSYGIPIVCASTFSRPRWAMPITTSCAPASDASSIVSSSIGIITSSPSSENCFWPRNALAQEPLHALDLAEAPEEPLLLVGAERRAVAARLDRLPQPDALLVVGEVLDLVGDRPAVGLGEPRQHVGERLAGDGDAQDGGGDARLQLGRQLRLEAQRLERGIADRLGAERVEPRREVAVGAVRLDERHRGGDAAEELRVGRRRTPAPLRERAARAVPERSSSATGCA